MSFGYETAFRRGLTRRERVRLAFIGVGNRASALVQNAESAANTETSDGVYALLVLSVRAGSGHLLTPGDSHLAFRRGLSRS